jgi:RecG-like helicase
MLSLEPLGLSAKQWQFLCDSGAQRYVDASTRKLLIESTRRQFVTARDILARLNGSQGEKARRGILLADDAGLGKTTVAALVAWVVASAGEKRGVRILAPNDVMARRWRDELFSQVESLKECAPALDVNRNRVKD